MDNNTSPIYTHLPQPLLIGVPFIDKEHDELFAQLDKLLGNPNTDTDAEIFSETLSQLGGQINAHFTHEEQTLKSLGMPEPLLSSHLQAHTDILDQYTHMNIDFMEGKARNRADVLRMIKSWIVGHVVVHDFSIKKYLPANIQPEP